MADPSCTICGEPRSAHIATEKGPLTHPREARGEGTYELEACGTIGTGPWHDDIEWARYKFVPTEEKS